MKHNTRSAAETLLEVIIAVSILSLLITELAGMYYNSIINRGANRNDLVAALLAEDGIETIINIRDTNLLKFSSKISECWNTKPEHVDVADCENPLYKISAGFYKLSFDPTGRSDALETAAPPLSSDLSAQTDSSYAIIMPDGFSFYRQMEIKYTGAGNMSAASTVLYRLGGRVRKISRNVILTNKPQ